MKDKRKYTRLTTAIGVAYKRIIKGKRQRTQLSTIRNLSGGGFCLWVKEPLRTGDLLALEIQVPYLNQPIDGIGEVVWCTSPMEEEGWETGVRFRDIEPESLNHILEYVHAVGIG